MCLAVVSGWGEGWNQFYSGHLDCDWGRDVLLKECEELIPEAGKMDVEAQNPPQIITAEIVNHLCITVLDTEERLISFTTFGLGKKKIREFSFAILSKSLPLYESLVNLLLIVLAS